MLNTNHKKIASNLQVSTSSRLVEPSRQIVPPEISIAAAIISPPPVTPTSEIQTPEMRLAICELCSMKERDTTDQLRRKGWGLYGGQEFCPACEWAI